MKRFVDIAAGRLGAVGAGGADAEGPVGAADHSGAAFVRRAARSDALAWHNEFGAARDVSGLSVERNVFRYLPFDGPVLIRRTAREPEASFVRVVAAGAAAGATIIVSSELELDAQIRAALRDVCDAVVVESEQAWLVRVAQPGIARVRLLGAPASSVTAVTGGRPDLAIYAGPATESGRIELLPFLREQAVAVTAHRFGRPDHLTDEIL